MWCLKHRAVGCKAWTESTPACVFVQEFSQKPQIEGQSRLSGNIDVKTCRDTVRIAASKEPITALVGFREWIFSGKVRGLHFTLPR